MSLISIGCLPLLAMSCNNEKVEFQSEIETSPAAEIPSIRVPAVESSVGDLDINVEPLKEFLIGLWEHKFKAEGVRELSGGETKVYKHTSYPELIFKTTDEASALRAKADATHKMASLVKQLGFDKVVVPRSKLIEVWSTSLNSKKLFLVEERFDVPVEPFESEYYYLDFYARFEHEPDLKHHFREMFLQLTELSAKLPGLWDAKHNNMPLERHPTHPRMVLVDIEKSKISEHSASDRLKFLFTGSNSGPIAHGDFFDDMYSRAKALVPDIDLSLETRKEQTNRDITAALAFRQYLETHRATPDAEISIDSLNTLDLTPTERKSAEGWIKFLNDQITHLKDFDGKKFTKFSAPVLRVISSWRICSRNDKVLSRLKDADIIFSFERVEGDDDYCTYTLRW